MTLVISNKYDLLNKLKTKENIDIIKSIKKNHELLKVKYNNVPLLHLLFSLYINEYDDYYFNYLNICIGLINIYDLQIINSIDKNGKKIIDIILEHIEQNQDNKNISKCNILINKIKCSNNVLSLLNIKSNTSKDTSVSLNSLEISIKTINTQILQILKRLTEIENKLDIPN